MQEHASVERKFQTPQEELEYLRSRVLEQEQQHLEAGVPYNRDAVIREKINEHKHEKPEEILKSPLGAAEAGAIVLDLKPKSTDAKIEELLGILEVKGLLNTLIVVEKMGNPQLEDDFHRVLVQYIKKNLPVQGVLKNSPLFEALHMTLFEVSLPLQRKEERGSFKELIAAMEQIYSGIIPARPEEKNEWLSFEVAVSNEGREVRMYTAVPDHLVEIFEKQTLSVIPGAKIREEKNDYNIFKDKGYMAASRASYRENAIFRLKNYTEFEHDPLTLVLNAFSKIAEVGEGVALQILVAPAKINYIQKYKNALKEIDRGVPVKQAIDIRESLVGDVAKGLGEIIGGLVQTQKKPAALEEQKRDEVLRVKKAIEEKIASPLYSVGIRIVTSAESHERALALLHSVEATFRQFENTSGNALVFKEYAAREAPRLARDFSFRVFERDEALPMSLRELSSIFHFPTESASSISELHEAKAGTAPAPQDMTRNGILLGTNRHRNQPTDIYMSPEDRLRHFYVIGQTGTGKSVFLKNMIIQDIKNGEGVCMIDPHGSDIEDILASVPPERHKDVIYFDPSHTASPMALNMLEYDERFPEQKTFVVNELISIFNKLFDMKVAGGPAFEQYFRNSALLVMDDPSSGSTLLEITRVLSDKKFRELKISRCKNPIVVQFWQNAERTTGEQSLANFVPYISNKFDPFISNDIMRPVIAQQKSSFNFRDIMDTKKILLVNLSKGRLGDINANLIGLMLVGKLLMAALSRVNALGKTLPAFYLYIDEFHNITTDSIATILSEARKYKLSLTVAHQFIAQLDERIRDAVFGNVGSMATFRVGVDDAEYLKKQFEPTFTENDIINLDNYHAYVRMLVGGRPAKPFNIETHPLPRLNHDMVDALKQESYTRYGRNRDEVERGIMERYRQT